MQTQRLIQKLKTSNNYATHVDLGKVTSCHDHTYNLNIESMLFIFPHILSKPKNEILDMKIVTTETKLSENNKQADNSFFFSFF